MPGGIRVAGRMTPPDPRIPANTRRLVSAATLRGMSGYSSYRMQGAPKLGPLELLVMDRLWSGGAQGVAAMHRSVGRQRGVSRNTIHSTLERLVRKDLAKRHRVGRAYEYQATRSRSEWVADSLTALLSSIPGSEPDALIASFVDVAEQTGDDALEALERLVRDRRRARSRGE